MGERSTPGDKGTLASYQKGPWIFMDALHQTMGPFSLLPALQSTATSDLPQYLAFCFCSRVDHLLSIIYR